MINIVYFNISNLKIEPHKGLKETHANLITKLENLSNERDEVRLNNEDAQKRHKMSLKNKAKLEKDIERLEKQNESTKSEFERLTLKVKQLVNQNSELEQLIERKARHAQEWIKMSIVSIYCILYSLQFKHVFLFGCSLLLYSKNANAVKILFEFIDRPQKIIWPP